MMRITVLISRGQIAQREENIYSYKNNFNYNYKVNLANNEFIKQEEVKPNQMAYITSLINDVDLNLLYNYSDSADSDINYEYTIDEVVSGIYMKDGEEQKVFSKIYNTTNESNLKTSGKEIKLEKNLKINIKELNEFIKNFEQTMNLSVDAYYTVNVNVKTKTIIDEKEIDNNYNSSVIIDLGKKTTQISGENNKEDIEYITGKVDYRIDPWKHLMAIVIDSIIGYVILKVLIVLRSKTETITILKNEYRQELNRMLKLCDDAIVKLNVKPDFKQSQIVDVADFGEIYKLSEELMSPILFWEDWEKEEAWFGIYNNNVVYRFIIKSQTREDI